MSNDELIALSTLSISDHLQAGFLALLAKFDFAIACKNNYALIHALLPKDLEDFTQPLTRSASSMLEDTAANAKPNGKDVEDINQESKILRKQSTPMELNEEELHKKFECQLEKFPKLKIVKGLEVGPSDLSFSHQMVPRSVLSLKAKDPHHVLHHNLYRVWLASFIPDGFWPQLLTRIISDDRISSILSDILSIPLNKSRYLSSDDSSLWKLCQKGLLIHYDQAKLLELKEVSSEIKNYTNKFDLSKNFATQIELTIYASQIAALRNAYQEISPKQNFINLVSKCLVVIEEHILDIGEEWFPDTFSDSCSKEAFSYIPCPVGLSQDGNSCILHSDNTNDLTNQFLCFGGHNIFCFSARDLLVAYATPSRSISCPTHKELLVKEIAPDMVRFFNKLISY